ncbi:MAG TPA: PEGA domain-containing protein [Myxococcota bacterium]|nr:PEGA domain-containing protein [Myxococcota bacterium]HRY93950.1 PEGA domain-containing protein [Myxococcota bacterium]HSA21265.1 PEGA domain-containing protein [Myxococcota bacterium]
MPTSPAPGERARRGCATPLGLLCLCLLAPGAGQAGERLSGPVAVLGLLGPGEEERTADMAAAVQAALAGLGGPEVLPAQETARRLGRGTPPAPASADLERLRGLFRQGYLQSYSFEYAAAVGSLQAVLRALDGLPDSEERWDLYVRAHVFLGIAKAGLGDEQGALQSFAAVLRTRPGMELPRTEYAPRSIALWESARRGLPGLPRGRLTVDSEPDGAEVSLDGVRVGVTPYIGEWPQGSYLLQLRSPAGSLARRVQLEAEPRQVRLQLAFEAALELQRAQPCVRLPAGTEALPDVWWPWLGARLGLRYAVVVSRRQGEGRPGWAASLVDLTRGRVQREGWLEPQDVPADARTLAEFAVTGRPADGLVLAEPAPPGRELAWRPGQEAPPFPVDPGRRPWFRTWWPYALASLALVGGGAGAHVASDHYARLVDSPETDTQGELEERERLRDTWLGVAIGGYCLGALALVTGLALHLTWAPELDEGGGVSVLLGPGGPGLGLAVVGSF